MEKQVAYLFTLATLGVDEYLYIPPNQTDASLAGILCTGYKPLYRGRTLRKDI